MEHVVYRNWCVMSSGNDWPHKDQADKERKLPEYNFDYCFPGDEFGYRLTILAGRERTGKAWMATAVPTKGAIGGFATDRCLDFVEECVGQENEIIIIKSDQEPAIEKLVGDIVKNRH